MIGGKGNDLYFVRDRALDVVIENANEGYDSIVYDFVNSTSAAVTITVAANVESVNVYDAIGLINITANNLGNDIFGNDAINIITGGTKDDYLFGYDGNDTLIGGAGDDILEGGLGNDNMIGGIGDDWYVIDNFNITGAADRVTEKVNEGNDTIELLEFTSTSTTIDMGAFISVGGLTFDLRQVENVLVNDSVDVTVTGNALNNSLENRSGSIVTFNGGLGNDHFVFGGIDPSGYFNSVNTLTSDTIDGGDGIDVLDAYLQNTTSTPTITNVEQINFWLGGADVTQEASNTIDATGINATTNPGLKTTLGLFNAHELDLVADSPFHNSVTLNGLQDDIALELRGRSDVTMTRATTADVTSQNLLLNGFDGSLALAEVEKLNITVGEASVIDLVDVTNLQANGVTLTGDGDLEISNLFDAGAQISRDEVTGDIVSTTGTGSLVLQDFTGGIQVAQAIDGVTQHITQNITLNNSVTGLFTDAEQLQLFSDISGNGSLGSTVDMNNVSSASVTVGHLESGDAGLVLMNLHVNVDASAFTGSLFAVADSNSNPVNIIGGQGDDTLIASDPGGMLAGGVGHDWLVGGDGSDGFLFTSISSTDSDRVSDFGAEDTILLGGDAAQGVTFDSEGLLISSDFFSGTLEDYAANASSEHIIYDQSLGNLYYDADGTAGGEVLIVNVGIDTTLTASNISSYAPG